jgi:hypothetical protein
MASRGCAGAQGCQLWFGYFRVMDSVAKFMRAAASIFSPRAPHQPGAMAGQAGLVSAYPLGFDGAMMLYCVRRSPHPGHRNGAMRMGE